MSLENRFYNKKRRLLTRTLPYRRILDGDKKCLLIQANFYQTHLILIQP